MYHYLTGLDFRQVPQMNRLDLDVLDKGGKFLKKLWCCVGGSITR